MGARQSRRSVDITTTPKKESIPKEGTTSDNAAEPSAAEKIEKLGSIEEAEAATPSKPTGNGIAHTAESPAEDKDKDEATEKDKAKEVGFYFYPRLLLKLLGEIQLHLN